MMAYSREKGSEEHILPVADGRQLSYTRNGPADAHTVVIFFCGILNVGTAHLVPAPFENIGAQWIAPTLPGMGNSSTRNTNEPYHVGLARDMSALLAHLYPDDKYDALYVTGGSYGTVPAQMLYGAPYDIFPAGRKIVASFLLSGFSPHKYHRDYTKSLSWSSWFSVGPPSQLVPFRLLQRTFASAVGSKMKTVDGAKEFLRQTIMNLMDDDEKKVFADWLGRRDLTEDAFMTRMANGTVACCRNWDGFYEVSDVIHSDWGFEPKALDDEHAKPVLVVSSKGDVIGGGTNKWLVENYQAGQEMVVPGGHISSLYYMDEICDTIIKAAGEPGRSFSE